MQNTEVGGGSRQELSTCKLDNIRGLKTMPFLANESPGKLSVDLS